MGWFKLKMRGRWLFVLVFLSLHRFSYADLVFEYVGTSSLEGFSAEETAVRMQHFLNEISDRLPPRIKNEDLNKKIQISFYPFSDGSESLQPICTPGLHVERLPQKWVGGLPTSLLRMGSWTLQWLRLNEQVVSLAIHPSLASVVLNGKEHAFTYPCGHGNAYQLVQAKIIHEIIKLSTPDVARGVLTLVKNFVQNLQYRYPLEDPLYYKLAGWQRLDPQNYLLWTQINTEGARSVSVSAPTKWPKEDLANRMEYFLLDPKNKCRDPRMYAYFKRIYDFEPFRELDCAVNTRVVLQSPSTGAFLVNRWVNLDPKRFYQIRYLRASGSARMGSQLGHAMYAGIVCRKGEERGPSCLSNRAEHVVFSYSAIIDGDSKPGLFAGVEGRYPSRFFIYPYLAALDQYTKAEFRDIESIPLELSQEEIESFVLGAILNYWQDSASRYRLFVGNCVTRSSDLIQSTSPRWAGKIFTSPTPSGLSRDFYYFGLAKACSLDEQQKIENGLYFPSEKRAIITRYKNLRDAAEKARTELLWPDYEKYIKESTASMRRNLFESFSEVMDPSTATRLLSFEKRILGRLQVELFEQSTRIFVEQYGDEGKRLLKEYKEFTYDRTLQETSPFTRLKRGYGIPTLDDFDWAEDQGPSPAIFHAEGNPEAIRFLNSPLEFQEKYLSELLKEMRVTEKNILILEKMY